MTEPLQRLENSLNPFDAESVMEVIQCFLDKSEDVLPRVWERAIEALEQVGRKSWWRCECGECRPDSGEIDLFCSHCGQMRYLPKRLSRSPWVLYIGCMRQRYPATWFELISEWLVGQGLAQIKERSVCPSGIATPRRDVATNASLAQGASHRYLHCIDEMKIYETGEIEGIQWISLPMKASFKK